jgi:histidinol-phosphatase
LCEWVAAAPDSETMSPDLALALRMADAADSISMASFRSADLQVETKTDGSPVTEVDRRVEATMQSIAAAADPADSFLGEEIGPSGAGARRWIFDGIDGTHNYAAGKVGWGTMIALEIDGEVELGVVSSPAVGIRWYAQRGFGSWRVIAGEDPVRVACSTATGESARVLASPPAGFLEGWRSTAADRVARGEIEHPRNFAWGGTLVADASHDATVLFSAAVWDIAANVVIVEEAGGCYRNVWGDRRLDTTTAVYGHGALVDELVALIADLVPPAPDAVVRRLPPTPSTR